MFYSNLVRRVWRYQRRN